MRAFVFLVLAAGALWALLHFYPRSESLASDPSESHEGGRGAETGRDGPPAAPSPGGSGASIEPPSAAGSQQPEWDVGLSGAPHLVELGALLAHGGAADLERALAARGESEPRATLALAFALALEGQRQRALDLAQPLQGDGGLGAAELELMGRALGRPPAGVLPTAQRAQDPLVRGMVMALESVQARAHLDAGRQREAARLYSDLLLGEIHAPWPSDRARLAEWTEGLRRAQAGHRWNPRSEWPAVEVTVRPGDSMTIVRRRVLDQNPELVICTGMIERANRIGGRYLQPDEVLKVPTEPVRTLVDLSARWVLYLLGDEVAAAWEVGIGREGHETYLGSFVVGDKQEKPMWFPGPGQDPVPHGHPENPLGSHWVGWNYPDGGKTGLGFHGTDEPHTVGQAVSSGCIRMRDEDVGELFRIIPRDTPVRVQP